MLRTMGRPGSVRRVAATEIENVVIQAVRDNVKPPEAVDDRGLVDAYVERVEICPPTPKPCSYFAELSARVGISPTQL